MRACSRCERELPEEAFARADLENSGWCKECRREYNRQYQLELRPPQHDEHVEHMRRYRLEELCLKTCSKCGEEKAVSEFYKAKREAGGVRSACKSCTYQKHIVAYINHQGKLKVPRSDPNSEWWDMVRWRVKKFNLDAFEYIGWWYAIEGRCQICGRDMEFGNADSLVDRGLAVNIDHDHLTGEVRGLLCRGCNVAIGMFGDDVARIRNAYKYLVV